MLTILSDPHQCAVHLVMSKTSVCRDLKNPTTSSTGQIQLSTQWQRTKFPIPQWQWTQLSNLNFSTDFPKFSNSQDHLFRAWRYPYSSPISCLGFIMTIMIVISFVCKHKTVPNVCAPELRAKYFKALPKWMINCN